MSKVPQIISSLDDSTGHAGMQSGNLSGNRKSRCSGQQAVGQSKYVPNEIPHTLTFIAVVAGMRFVSKSILSVSQSASLAHVSRGP